MINVILIILVILVRITTILGKENINLMKKFLESLRSSRQHLMEKLKRGGSGILVIWDEEVLLDI